MKPIPLHTDKNGTPALGHELSRVVRGGVRFDAGARALFSADASNYRHVPIGVVFPKDAQDVLATLRVCRAHGVPILSRGGGTSLGGQTTNVAVIMDFSRHMSGVLQIDVENRFARVLPGTVLDHLRQEAEKYGLTFGPDPSTHDRCTLGGMIGNSACGIHAVMSEFYGPGPRTEDNVEELEIATYDGLRMRVGSTSEQELSRIIDGGGRRAEIYRRLAELRDRYGDLIRRRFPDIPRRVSGYNLTELLPERGFNVARALVGSEGTCVTVLEAKLSLIDAFPARSLLVVGFDSIFDAGEIIPRVREHRPIGCEGFDRRLIEYDQKKRSLLDDIALLPEGNGWLLIEFGGQTKEEADDRARRCLTDLKRAEPSPTEVRLMDDPGTEAKIWAVRESALGATAFVPGEHDTWPGWEDAAVPVDRVGDYLRDFRSLLERHDLDCSLYGHFGQGCIHTRIDFDFSSESAVQRYANLTADAADLVVSYGGSLSGEHGDGQARSDLLEKMYGPELVGAFREFKAILGSGAQAESGAHRGARCTYRGSPVGAGPPAAASRHLLRIPRGRRRLRPRDGALCGSWQVPAGRRRNHVPELASHARRAAHHPGTRPLALRNATRGRHHRRLEQ